MFLRQQKSVVTSFSSSRAKNIDIYAKTEINFKPVEARQHAQKQRNLVRVDNRNSALRKQ